MVYFFKNRAGEPFAVEGDAADYYYKQGFEYLGATDGSSYLRREQELSAMVSDKRSAIITAEDRLERLITAKDRLELEEFLPEDDERMVRASVRIKEAQENLQSAQDAFNQVARESRTKALSEEIARADKSITPPDSNWKVFSGTTHVRNKAQASELLAKYGR